jgi:hypothetical protein
MLLHTLLRMAFDKQGILDGSFVSSRSFSEINQQLILGNKSFLVRLQHEDKKIMFRIPAHQETCRFHEQGTRTVPRKILYPTGINTSTSNETLEFSWVPAEQPEYLGFTVTLHFRLGHSGLFELRILVPDRFPVWEKQTKDFSQIRNPYEKFP